MSGVAIDPVSLLLVDVREELERARQKFPDNRHSLTALMEEVGELSKAMLDESRWRVRDEAIQVAAMAIRVALDGDRSFNDHRNQRRLDP